MLDIKELESLKEELMGYEKEKLRREERLKHCMSELKKMGFSSIADAEKGLEDILARITRLEGKLQKDYNEFVDNYAEIFGVGDDE